MTLGKRHIALVAALFVLLMAVSAPVRHVVGDPRPRSGGVAAVGVEQRPAPGPAAVGRPSPERFYPRVQDGWRDDVRLAWTVDPSYKSWTGRAIVTRGDGPAVGRYRLGTNPTEFRWRGLYGTGEPMPRGRYHVRVTLRPAMTDVLTGPPPPAHLSFPVRISAKTVTRTATATIRPADEQLRNLRVRGDCATTPHRGGALLFQCRYGGYLQAAVPVAVPAGASIDAKRLRGRVGCCWPGLVRRFWLRPDPSTVLLGIRVTGDRSYRLDAAAVTYTATVRR